MELEAAEAMARELMASYLDRSWRFRFDNAKRRLGCCHWATRTISLSRHFVVLNDEPSMRDTILHEIAHALASRGAGHGWGWKRIALTIGATPVRCADDPGIVSPVANWVSVCPSCGDVLTRYRAPHGGLACAKCCRRYAGGRYSPDFALSWRRVDVAGVAGPIG